LRAASSVFMAFSAASFLRRPSAGARKDESHHMLQSLRS
jgi:hypothetical protein